jgi:putative transposase
MLTWISHQAEHCRGREWNHKNSAATAGSKPRPSFVLMPEHFHFLIHPSAQANPSHIIQNLKERTALFALEHLRQSRGVPWCRQILERLTLPSTVHVHGPHRAWQRRVYDLNVWSEKKTTEKPDYMHNSPAKRGLVDSPDQWRWSSFRFYYLEDSSMLATDPPA